MQTTNNEHLEVDSLDFIKFQTQEINHRFKALETFLESSFHQVFSLLNSQQIRVDSIANEVLNVKKESRVMAEHVKGLFIKKELDTQLFRTPNPVRQNLPKNGNYFSNNFQLNKPLNQIKAKELLMIKNLDFAENKEDLKEERSLSLSASSLLKQEFGNGLQISFEPLKKQINRSSVGGTPSQKKSLNSRRFESLKRFETPQGRKEMRENLRCRGMAQPPKIRSRPSLISKNKKNDYSSLNKLKKRNKTLRAKNNIHLLANKLGKIRFGSDDLMSNNGESFQDQSHFLDKMSGNLSIRSELSQNKQIPRSFKQEIQALNKKSDNLIFNAPICQMIQENNPKSNLGTSLQDSEKQQLVWNNNSNSRPSRVTVPSLHLESSVENSQLLLRSEKGNCSMVSDRTIQKDSLNKKKYQQSFNIMEVRSPSSLGPTNFSVFSVNKTQADLSSKNIPNLPPLQVDVHDQKLLRQVQPRLNAHNRSNLLIRDPNLADYSHSSINHSKLQRNLNAIKFDLSYNTEVEVKDSFFGLGDSKFDDKSINMQTSFSKSGFNMTPFQIRNQQTSKIKDHLQRQWSINQVPKSAYLDRIRHTFDQNNVGLKVNQNGQVSMDDSAFSEQLIFPVPGQTIRSSNSKHLFPKESDQIQEEMNLETNFNPFQNQKAIAKKIDFDNDNEENRSVRTAQNCSSSKPKKNLPEFDCSIEGYNTSMFSEDFDLKQSFITRKEDEPENFNDLNFTIEEDLLLFPRPDTLGNKASQMGQTKVPESHQMNMNLLDELDFHEEMYNDRINNKKPMLDICQKRPAVKKTFGLPSYRTTLTKLKTQLDEAHYKMFDSRFDIKFEELTNKLQEFWELENDISQTKNLLIANDPNSLQKVLGILGRRGVQEGVSREKLCYSQQLEKVSLATQTGQLEKGLLKLMIDPSGFNSFLILIKQQLLEQSAQFLRLFN